MSNLDRSEIEELLSSYIDDELSQRQHTEVERLIRHDEQIAAQVEKMHRHKDLLGALPKAPAPNGLLDEIQTSLERKLILDTYSKDSNELAGAKHLFYRRVLTAAAMLVLPLGILALVILSILAPGPQVEKGTAIDTQGRQLAPDSPPAHIADGSGKSAAGQYPFNAMLELSTNRPIAMTDFIQKAIYNNSLLNYTMPPDRSGSNTAYRIACPAEGMIALLGGLESGWDKCENTSLTLYGPELISDSVVIDHVTAEQIATVLQHDDAHERVEIAAGFAEFNSIIESTSLSGGFAIGIADYAVMTAAVKPILTSDERAKTETRPPAATEKVSLVIVVRGI